jgi:hypothetical protein
MTCSTIFYRKTKRLGRIFKTIPSKCRTTFSHLSQCY